MALIECRNDKNAGIITLNRPEALNALNTEMVADIAAALRHWQDDETVARVIITSSSERAFCAGGDVREAVSMIAQAPETSAEPYFSAEYGLDIQIASYPKPIISLVNGIVMGGGLGLARLSDMMIVSETIKLAMPETAIGLFPDVGASHFLRKMPIEAALMIGMTGTILTSGDVMAWELADAHVAFDNFDEVIDRLASMPNDADLNVMKDTISGLTTTPPEPFYANQMDVVTSVFGHNSLSAIIDAAKTAKEAEPWHHALTTRCPTSIGLFWHLMMRADEPDNAISAIQRDYFLACKMMRRPDFVEGVRAVLIDKDNQPNWQTSMAEVTSGNVLEELFDFSGMSPLPVS
ncbi:MAG: enoyl-CoA hydratase/isomerase family protein [Candidatus Puniceispirillaceae bacterium]